MSAIPARSTSCGSITPITTLTTASCRIAANFLLTKGVDPQEEILDTERLLIANGETPSLFFRFPGLVSSDPLMQAVSQFHLVTLGADAWLA